MKVCQFCGGEPTASWNIESVIWLCKEFKKTYPNKNIWMWSGRTFESIQTLEHGEELLSNIDMLIDGPFIEELKDISLKFRGSSNQHIWEKQPLGFFVRID